MKKKNKPKVLIDAFHLYNALTGIKTYSVLLFEALEESEMLASDYIIYPNWQKAEKSRFLKGKLGLFKKLVHHGGFLIYKQFFLPVYALFKGVDAVVSLDFVLPKVKFGKKSFVVIHDVFFWELKENYPDIWRNYFTKMIDQGIGSNTVLISTSEYTSEKIRQFLARENDIEVVYQSPKLLEDIGGDEKILASLGLSPGGYFFHVGLIDKRKNLITLTKAFANYRKCQPNSTAKLVLAGERGIGKAQDIYDQLISLVRDLGLVEEVIMPGFVSNQTLGALYRNTVAYIFPSFDEGFGIPVLEAFHARVPVVISDRGALKEVAGEGALVFPADNARALCECLLKLEDSDTREKLVKRGTERLSLFSKGAFGRNFDRVVSKHMMDQEV